MKLGFKGDLDYLRQSTIRTQSSLLGSMKTPRSPTSPLQAQIHDLLDEIKEDDVEQSEAAMTQTEFKSKFSKTKA